MPRNNTQPNSVLCPVTHTANSLSGDWTDICPILPKNEQNGRWSCSTFNCCQSEVFIQSFKGVVSKYDGGWVESGGETGSTVTMPTVSTLAAVFWRTCSVVVITRPTPSRQ